MYVGHVGVHHNGRILKMEGQSKIHQAQGVEIKGTEKERRWAR